VLVVYSILTTFESSAIFEAAAGAVIKIDSSLNPNRLECKFSLAKSAKLSLLLFSDLDKLNMVKFAYGNLVLGSSDLGYCPKCHKNDNHFKSSQKRHKINFPALLV